MLTMGVYAEERKRGTIELLMTSPITDLEIVLGKFLASLTLFAVMLLPTAILSIFMISTAIRIRRGAWCWSGISGCCCWADRCSALGSFISSLTENQMIAAVFTFAAFLMLWVIDLGRHAEGGRADFRYLSVIRHYDDFTRGIIDTSA